VKLIDLRGILQYVPQFREKTFVISVDGVIVADEHFGNLLMDIAVLRSLNVNIVLAHGASAQIQDLARQQGITPSDLDGAGITDSNTLKLALTAANRLTHEILEGLSTYDLRAASTNAIIAHPMGIIHGVDHQLTGKVEKVDVEFLQILLANDIIPVIPPLGVDGEGNTYRVNSDHIAVAVAEALKAIKLIFVTNVDGLYYQGKLIRQMIVGELEEIIQTNKNGINPECISKAIYSVQAAKAGIPRIHIINGRLEEGLLAEVFSNEGVGTLIYANEYQQIRKALKKDIRQIIRLLKPHMESEELARRTRAMIEKQINDYYLFEIDNNPVACVALHVYPEQNVGELASLCVSKEHENQGIGRKLIKFVEDKAREMNLDKLIALSTQAFTYFQTKAGFIEGTPNDLPPARREKYESSCRKSKILIKYLKTPLT
jgi:amino-acid N-acetyltransferase